MVIFVTESPLSANFDNDELAGKQIDNVSTILLYNIIKL